GDDVGLAFELTVVVDGQDAGMTELGDRHRLTAKALAKLDVLGQKLGEDLDRNVALERRLIGLEHRGHAAATDLLDDLVGAHLDAGRDLHWPGSMKRAVGRRNTATADSRALEPRQAPARDPGRQLNRSARPAWPGVSRRRCRARPCRPGPGSNPSRRRSALLPRPG